MHERIKSKKRWTDLRKPIWKVIDDYSGLSLYSYQVTFDYRGFVTQDGREDIEPPAEHPIPTPKEQDTFDRYKDS